MIAPLSPYALVLQTPRLRLAPLSREDEDLVRALLCDPEVMRHVVDPKPPRAVRDFMDDAVRRGAGGRFGVWCVPREDTGQKIGDGVLLPVPVDEDDTD